MKNLDFKIWKESYRWQYEAYPLFASVYQRLALKTNKKYFTRWEYFLNYFHDGQLEAYIPQAPLIKTGEKVINELLAGNDSFIKEFDVVHQELKDAIKLCLKTRKNKDYQNLKKWWLPTQKALSAASGILFGFDYALDEFLKNKGQEDPKELKSITSNIRANKKSFIRQAQEKILKLKKIYNGNWDKIFPKFIEEYGWFQNSYKGKFQITKEWLMNFSKQKEAIDHKNKKPKLDKKYRLLAEAASQAIIFRDDKKKLLLLAVDLIDTWGHELCAKEEWPFNELKWLSMDEIIKILDKGNLKILNKAKKCSKNKTRYGVMIEDGFLEVTSKLWIDVENFFYQNRAGVKEIKGMVGNSKKIIKGKVRVIFDPKISDIKRGDILVTSMTRPEFLPLMQKASAFITDEGGITCHAAIVAREMNKPCIIGTKIATKILHDGDLVELDASKGIIKILNTCR